jgi:peptidoglycan/xylan/chitin deacetylase (PgdA/CDA1 family)
MSRPRWSPGGWSAWFARHGIGRGRVRRVRKPTLCLSFDYERGFAGEDAGLADRGLEGVLHVLAQRRATATFHCVARVAQSAPERLREIRDGGHEIACHGYAHESPRDLTRDGQREMLRLAREAFERVGVRPIGFRSPRSHWDRRLCAALADEGYWYDAEHDAARQPYVLLDDPRPLLRLPIRGDDWDRVRRPARSPGFGRPDEVEVRHRGWLEASAARRGFIALGYHPWLLAATDGGLDGLGRLLDAALNAGVQVRRMGDVARELIEAPGGADAGGCGAADRASVFQAPVSPERRS